MRKQRAIASILAAPSSRSQFLRATFYREQLRVARPLRSALPFLALSLSLGALMVLLALYTPCYQLSVNGVQVGPVHSREMVAQSVTQVEGQVSRILDQSYTLNVDLGYQFVVAAKEDLLSYSRLSDAFYQAVPDIKEAYVLTVDGVNLGSSGEKAVLDQALVDLQQQYRKENTKEVFFANEARITRKYIPTTEAFSEEAQLKGAMAQSIKANTAYEVQAGDSLASIAAAHGMSKGDLLALNQNIKKNAALNAGQIITVQKTVPRLSVCTVDQISYTREVASPIREVKDGSLYEGDKKVLVQGAAGTEQVKANVTHFNGEAMYEEVLSREVITAPTETVMAVGTQERPAYYSTGSLQWPTSGKITSPFGYRYIFGSSTFHSGLDIANSYGTGISAADSGVVTYVGYKGSYGNLIIIDHGNGWETYYSHCATVQVSEGDGVTKGDRIATMGSTGRATGNHLHFEVHIGGEAVNPQKYLP